MLPGPAAQGIVTVMLCPKCGKDSNNFRVCAFCQVPYPTGNVDVRGQTQHARATASIKAAGLAGSSRNAIARLAPAQRWGLIGLLAAVTVGYYVTSRERVIPVGVAISNRIAGAMSPGEAASTLKTVNRTSQVELRDGELFVRISAAAFPQRREGQLALAQQYARADEIVEGRKRVINFLDPDGNRFARSDAETGVAMTR